jgi:hypothetical protein
MQLATIYEEPPDPHCEQGGAILADSGVDLGDEVACMAVINASGMSRGSASLMCMRITAHNIRTQRLIVSRSSLRLMERADA